jgi:hypothetical protein
LHHIHLEQWSIAMRIWTMRAALVAGVAGGVVGSANEASAQTASTAVDSAPHFAFFGGMAASQLYGVGQLDLRLGGSGDFRLARIPVPLRLSLSANQRYQDYQTSTIRGGSASLDLVMRPIPAFLGLHPYFLGGVGLSTLAPYASYRANNPNATTLPASSVVTVQRQTWAFGSLGMGVDIGHAFIEAKMQAPIVSNGPMTTPVSVGFRFWD